MKTRILFLVVSVILFSDLLSAQTQTDKIAFAGPNGIFINTGIEIPFQNSDNNNSFKYKIERALVDQDLWTEVALLTAPENFDSFKESLMIANSQLQDSIPLSELPLELIWQKSVEMQRLDSLKYLGNPLNVKLALAVCYLDKQIETNKEYIYRISTLDKTGNVVQSFTSNRISYPGKFKSDLFKVADRELSDNFIRIKWEADKFIRTARFKVFRRENFENSFTEIFPVKVFNEENTKISISIIDTSVNSNKTYQYFIIPTDHYQNEGLESDTVVAIAFSFSKVFPPYSINVVSEDSIEGLKLNWKFDNKDKLVSFKIFRSTSADTGFIEISEVSGFDSAYYDFTAEPLVLYYYYLQLNDPLNEVPLQSAKVFGLYKSKNKPQPPFDLVYQSTNEGIKIEWNRPGDYVNTYRIFRNIGDDNALAEYFILHSKDSVIQFIDSISILTENRVYYYSIKSETNSGVLSEFSDTIRIASKIKMAIQAPRQLIGSAYDGSVNLYWENLFENVQSILGYKVFRKNYISSSDGYEALFDTLLPPKINNYVDTSVIAGNKYEYAVKVYDIFNNESELSSSIIINLEALPFLPPAGITAVNTDRGVLLSWQTPLQENISEFKIYRYQRGDDPKVVGVVKKEETEFLDKGVNDGNLYFYFITSVDYKSNESLHSQEIGIRR